MTTFGTLPDGREVREFVLQRANGPRLAVLDLGATVNSFRLDGDDPSTELVVNFPTLDAQQAARTAYFGAVIGRYANRIAQGRFTLDGVEHQITQNEGTTALHGGVDGFDARTWDVAEQSDERITFELTSPDGDQGFPGEVVCRATYTLTADGFALDLSARTDAPTVCALTSHLYLNLAGAGSILDHELTVDADGYLPIDAESIPLGRVEDVSETPFDLRGPVRIGDRVTADHPQIAVARGIDHSFDLRPSQLDVHRAVRLACPANGRVLEVWTDQPAVQVYTGNFLDGSWTSSAGPLEQYAAIAIEPQQHPDSPNQDWGRSAVLRPGEDYRWHTEWRFS